MFKHSISLILYGLTFITSSYVPLSRTITSVGVEVTTVACLGAFYMRASSPKESPAASSAMGTYQYNLLSKYHTMLIYPVASLFLNLSIVTLPVYMI
jgi:hypothetical protein